MSIKIHFLHAHIEYFSQKSLINQRRTREEIPSEHKKNVTEVSGNMEYAHGGPLLLGFKKRET